MTDVSLNGLKVKTDSLPNDWYVSLINPESGEPAEIMTVAKLVELFTAKQPEATNNSNGIMSSSVFKQLFKNMGTISNKDLNDYLGLFIGYSADNLNGPSDEKSGYIIGLGTPNSWTAQLFFGAYSNRLYYRIYIFSNWSAWNTVSYTTNAVSANALTDTISVSPVLESRQVRSTCLQNHLYQILLPTCQDRMDRMVQHQLKVNHRNSMSGQSTRSEKLSWNYRKKTRDLNKSSISLTIARYNKCNLPRAGPPRLIN